MPFAVHLQVTCCSLKHSSVLVFFVWACTILKESINSRIKQLYIKRSPAVRKERGFLKILNLLWKTQLSNWNTQRCSHDITTLLMISNNDGGQWLQWKENLPQCTRRTSILFGVTFSQGKEFTIVCLYQRNAPFKIAFHQPFQKNSSCLSQT